MFAVVCDARGFNDFLVVVTVVDCRLDTVVVIGNICNSKSKKKNNKLNRLCLL
jgi:hypothetical protein